MTDMSDTCSAAATATAAAIAAAAAAMSAAAHEQLHQEQQQQEQQQEYITMDQRQQQQQHQPQHEPESHATNALYEEYAAVAIASLDDDLVGMMPVPNPTAVAAAVVACGGRNSSLPCSRSSITNINNTGRYGDTTTIPAIAAASCGSGGGNHGSRGGGEAQPQPQHSLSHAYQTYLSHDRAEQEHWDEVCRAYRSYATFAMLQWHNHQLRLAALPEAQRQFLPAALRCDDDDTSSSPSSLEFQKRVSLYKNAAIRNQFCLDCILRHGTFFSSVALATNHRLYISLFFAKTCSFSCFCFANQ
jgi:hypothetical protein